MISRRFAECLAASAAACVLFLAGVHDSLVGPLPAFFSPAPLVWAAFHLGVAESLVASFLAAAVILPFAPLPVALSFVAGSALPAVLMGELWRRGRGMVLTVSWGVGAVLFLSLVFSALYLTVAGLEPLTFLRYQMGDMQREAEFAMEALAGGPGEPGGLLPAYFARILPAFVLISVFVQCSLNLFLVRFGVARMTRAASPMPDVTTFSLPEKAVWGLIPALALQWAPSAFLRTVAVNLIIVLLFYYFIQGLSILFHFARRMKVPRLFAMVLVIIFLFLPYLFTIPLLAGLLDFRFDFRHLRAAPDTAS